MSFVPQDSPSAAPQGFRITRERGPMTRQVRDAALARGGQEAWEALLASVSPACRERFAEPIGYFDWVESELALELHEAWARFRGEDDMALRGEQAAQDMVGGAQRWVLRMASPSFVLQNVPRGFGLYYFGGQMELQSLGQGRATMLLRASGYPDSWFRHALPGWFRVALDLAGAKGVTVRYQAPDPAGTEPWLHRYEIGWN